MKRDNYIQEELRIGTPVIAEIENKPQFSVPSGYFENLSLQIIQKIKEGREPRYSFSNSMPFSVPEGYFETFSKIVLEKVSADKERDNGVIGEMETISPFLNTVNKETVHKVPEGYFETFSETVLEKVLTNKAENDSVFEEMEAISPLLNTINKKTLYSIPDAYFETFLKTVSEKTLTNKAENDSVFEEMETISPLLNTINKQPVFSVPDGYFNDVTFTAPVTARPAAKVVSLGTNRRKFISYAIAAVIATIMAVGIFLITGKESTNSIASSEVHNQNQVKNLTDEEIEVFLKTNAPNEVLSSVLPNAGKENEIKKSISKMSDEEIKDFLQETGEADEI